MHIGIAGTGKMGAAMAVRLQSLGHQVTVWNRTRARAEPLLAAGMGWADTPQALADSTEVVISIITNDQALDEVYGSASGLFKAREPNRLFIEMSTVPPGKQEAMAALARAAGVAYLECPVSGSIGPAREGKLMGFAGGEAEVLARARPVLEGVCRRIEHVGLHGAGARMKLAINLPLMVYWQTLGEALSIIEPLNLDPKLVVELFSESSGGPNMLKVRGGMLTQALAHEPSEQVTVQLAVMRKDVRSMLEHIQSMGRSAPLVENTLQQFDRAAAQGLDEADCTRYPVWWVDSRS
ncbi:MAG: NAD(P)-dependent oxidoreductase [Betaproteobacteria bacterium]|jgi:3-hydroxyisobutyrate dehydrogenase|nr:NAD(P)-dependent oxidoreductase [Betaproteobacteria bacterium]NBU43887.1 NAD(P)-dependent oxidoreductase [Betaproteobacteria bacterium]